MVEAFCFKKSFQKWYNKKTNRAEKLMCIFLILERN